MTTTYTPRHTAKTRMGIARTVTQACPCRIYVPAYVLNTYAYHLPIDYLLARVIKTYETTLR